MITVHRICPTCARTFTQLWQPGAVLLTTCPSCILDPPVGGRWPGDDGWQDDPA